MSLYRRYRPDTLAEIRGNRSLVVTLKGMLADIPTLPHTFLFHGPTGCGKTTLARILANALNCKKSNLIEIDTAQFTGIDTVRDIRKNAQFIPLGGGVRVFIIDEVQKMTTPAQHAFLKILEDTPDHIYFILCTTEQKSLLPTVRGRCSTFQVAQLKEGEMEDLLIDIADKEGDRLTAEVLKAIIDSSEGHPRNALTILEQVLKTPERRRVQVARQAQIVQAEGFKLAQLLFKKAPWKEVATVLTGLKQEDAEGVRRIVMGYATSVLIKGGKHNHAAYMLECFIEPFYNSLFNGLVYASYQVLHTEN